MVRENKKLNGKIIAARSKMHKEDDMEWIRITHPGQIPAGSAPILNYRINGHTHDSEGRRFGHPDAVRIIGASLAINHAPSHIDYAVVEYSK